MCIRYSQSPPQNRIVWTYIHGILRMCSFMAAIIFRTRPFIVYTHTMNSTGATRADEYIQSSSIILLNGMEGYKTQNTKHATK